MTEYFGRPLKLEKGLYGTTYSARWWWEELHDWLIENNFECAISDFFLYVLRGKNGKWLKIINYIDDMLCFED